MHGSFRDSYAIDEAELPIDLEQTPADLVVLSFSDSDLGAFAAGWRHARADLPTLRLANLVGLRHPMSVDMYVERTLTHAKAILIRLIGGESYWPYGLQQVAELARRNNIALAVLPADGRRDPALDGFSTVPAAVVEQLKALCDEGGMRAAQAALAELARAAGLTVPPAHGATIVPECGWYDPALGVVHGPQDPAAPVIAITFYRSYLMAADTEPIDALIKAFRARGLNAIGLFVPSLKAKSAAAWMRNALTTLGPAAIVNATAFSARDDRGSSPLDVAGCPVFQVALSTARKRDWQTSDRGLSATDLAMHVVLPEVDGRMFAGAISFKAPGRRDPDLQFSRFSHRSDPSRVEAAVDRVMAWTRLAATPPGQRKIALVLSTYPGRADQLAHAVGLDALASTDAILADLDADGYQVAHGTRLADTLSNETIGWPIDAYRAASQLLPATLQEALSVAWGVPEADPAFRDGAFRFAAVRRGTALIALQPERGDVGARDSEYHDLARTPRHGYVAFYLWLRSQGIHALVHVGAHGTLEWLPGKSVALSDTCWPEALTAGIPVIYPFIVNDPGEAAQAKRRIGAMTLGHLPPAQLASSIPEGLRNLERLLDEYSTADGLDPARRMRLVGLIRSEAQSAGVEQDLGLPPTASAIEAIIRIDRFVCDIKASQFGDGLHIYGQGAGERDGLLAALAGLRVDAGPAGSPWRGRSDVLPTGRNLYSVDPRAVPSRTAHAQGVKLAEELLRRYLQDHGDWPQSLVVDLWGSATMRTAGEEFAMALHLAGLAPRWDVGSERVTGFEILPVAALNRPRVDITLRVSGLFRDVFPGLTQLFEAGVAALADSHEREGDNPYVARVARVFGPRPGHYGLGMGRLLDDFSADGRKALGEAWLAGSEWTIDATGAAQRQRAVLEARVLAADGFAHIQDLAETDLLLASDYASHEGGFAAAVASLGGQAPTLYHLDATRPDAPQARTLPEEIARVVRARAANPDWIDGMMRHRFRGAAEIAATLDHLAAFAHLTRAVPGHLFDLYHDATLGRAHVTDFMTEENPAALAALRARFQALHDAGLWTTRRNSIAAMMEDVRA
jgi:cobaltochelatase CobN